MAIIERKRKDIAYSIEFDDSVITNDNGAVLGDITIYRWNREDFSDGYIRGTHQFRFSIPPGELNKIKTKLLLGIHPTFRIVLNYHVW